MTKESMIFYREWRRAVEELEPVQRCQVYEAIFDYAFDKIEPSDAILKAITSLMRDKIDRDNEAYQAKCDKNKANGKKGGNPNFVKGKANPYHKKNDIINDNPKITQDNPTVMFGYPKITQDNPTITQDNPTITQDNPTLPHYDYDYDYSHISTREREEFLEGFFSEERKAEIEQLCMARHFDGIEDFKRLADIVMSEWVLTGKTHTSKQDAYSHLISHCSKQKQAERRNKPTTHSTTTTNHVTTSSYNDSAAARAARRQDIAQHIAEKLAAGEQPESDLSCYY